MAIDLKRIAINAGGIASNNAAGIVFALKNANGNSAIDEAFSNMLTGAGVPAGTAVKAIKTLTYDVLGLAALELTEGKSEMVQIGGNYMSQFLTGLGTSTLAADPTYVSAVPGQMTSVISQQPQASPQAAPSRAAISLSQISGAII